MVGVWLSGHNSSRTFAGQPGAVLLVVFPVLLLTIPAAIHDPLTFGAVFELPAVSEHELGLLAPGTTLVCNPLVDRLCGHQGTYFRSSCSRESRSLACLYHPRRTARRNGSSSEYVHFSEHQPLWLPYLSSARCGPARSTSKVCRICTSVMLVPSVRCLPSSSRSLCTGS